MDELLVLSSGTLVVIVAVILLYIAASWRIFTKAGIAGWKSLIPIYSTYLLYKIGWNTKYFWLFFVLSMIDGSVTGKAAAQESGGIMIVALIVAFLMMIINVLFNLNIAKRFGHGTGFGLGLLFLPSIFMLILAFDGNAYQPDAQVTNLPIIN